MKIIKSIDDKRLQSSFYEKNDISTFLLKKKLFNFYTNTVGTIRLKTVLPNSYETDLLCFVYP